jgi:Spy/CpxP family protein refolding chaperone
MSDGADDAFAATASRAAEAEAACRRARTVMLYRMFRQLSPRQRQRLAELGGGQRTSVRSPRPGDSLITNDVRAY